MLPSFGPTELIVLLVLVLLLFGAKRVPELAKGLGTGIREFRQGVLGGGDREAEHDPAGELPEGEDALAEQRR